MKKSGRALKIVRAVEDYNVKEKFLNRAYRMFLDTQVPLGETSDEKHFDVIHGDIRTLEHHTLNDYNDFNLVVFSPPYLNHFDYTEVYKLELWMLGFISNSDEFRSLRKRTFRSHSSIKTDKTATYKKYNSMIIKNLVELLDNNDSGESFVQSVKGYIDDMYSTFEHLSTVTTDDVVIACIVANSLFGSVSRNNLTPIATDLIISEIARDVGFVVKEIKIARTLTRRGVSFPYGRESIIIIEKPLSVQSRAHSKQVVNEFAHI